MFGLRSKSFLAILFAILLSGCADIEKQIDEISRQVDPVEFQDIENYLNQQGIDTQQAAARASILARAATWVNLKVPYNQGIYLDGYRTDCSGFVSYSWKLKDSNQTPISPDTIALGKVYGVNIYIENIQPGDIINNRRAGNDGHVVLFVRWIDEKHTKFMAYEENGGYGKAVQTELTIIYNKDKSFTIQEYNIRAPGPYYAQRSPYIP